MGAIASQITGVSIVYWTICLGADRRRHQSSPSLAFVRGIHRWPVNSPHRGPIYTLRPRQYGRHFPDDIFQCVFFNENIKISITISLKFVLKCSIIYHPALIMAWCRPGDNPLSEPMKVSLLTHICVTRSQWVQWKMFPFDDVIMSITWYRLRTKCMNLFTHISTRP